MLIICILLTVALLIWTGANSSDTYGLSVFVIGIPGSLLIWLVYFMLKSWGVF